MIGHHCRSCGSELRQVFLDLGSSPLSNRYLQPADMEAPEPHYPLVVRVCPQCHLVQLPQVVEPEHIFTDYAYFSSYSDSWLKQCENYVARITPRLGLDGSSRVVELASNDGYLLHYFAQRGIPVLGVEPAVNVAAEAQRKGIPTLVRFFGTQTAKDMLQDGLTADLLIGNNVLAHVPDLNDFIEGIRILLKPDGIFTMEFPHLPRLMEGNQFDTIYHEHFSYFSFIAAETAFGRHGLSLFDVEELTSHGGSLRIYGKHTADGSRPIHESIRELRARELALGFDRSDTYERFAQRVESCKHALLSFLLEAKRLGKRVAGYGAPAKGNTLLNYCGIRSDLLAFTVDRSEYKQGRHLPGSRIPIFAPGKILETRPDYLLILPWNLQDEIVGQMGYIREWGGRFVVPIPEVQILP